MKKFYFCFGSLVAILILEIIKYFSNYIVFYCFFSIQLLFLLVVCGLLFSKIQKKIYLTIAFCFSLIFLATPIICGLAKTSPITSSFSYVIHAGGSMDNKTYLNSQEGFINSIEKDQKYIELDFLYTLDKQTICSHFFEYISGFGMKNRPTLQDFQNCKILNKYNGITFDWLIDQLKCYQDVTIIFDTKEEDSFALLKDMMDYSLKKNFDISTRFIIQVYSLENYLKISENLNFKRFWFTNYKSCYSPLKIKSIFSKFKNIETIVLHYSDWWVLYQTGINLGKKIAVHTLPNQLYSDFPKKRSVDYIFIDNYV